MAKRRQKPKVDFCRDFNRTQFYAAMVLLYLNPKLWDEVELFFDGFLIYKSNNLEVDRSDYINAVTSISRW